MTNAIDRGIIILCYLLIIYCLRLFVVVYKLVIFICNVVVIAVHMCTNFHGHLC